ncbi:glycoside hydrolase family 3 protein [Polaribacter sp. Q13]|uniref:beta-glucosidase n=1 Tax=Polaribacter sp. Q13 TaxID=2806551 RepID=UPI00193B3F1B|nr:glycoside hydrolase family 3 N-terminal domain-containing protein [Polaribacter sp. Q13]QVY66076.1 glycoside hydrolase family 3 protein [Polaribacter sp. Q13]
MRIARIFIVLALVSQVLSSQSIQLTKTTIEQVIKEMTVEEKADLVVGNRGIPRFGIPKTKVCDGPAGVKSKPNRKGVREFYTSWFPSGTNIACSWNLELAEQVGAAMGKEAFVLNDRDVLLAPGLNIHRNPLCGRNFEYYSEDPLLSGKLAGASVRGIETVGIGTSIKHFAANNQETFRTKNDSRMSQRALREIYLKGFKIAIDESNPMTVMASYNALNGELTQESKALLIDVLRKDWGYEGLVVSDWTKKRNTVLQMQAGCNLLMPGYKDQRAELIEVVNSGELSMEDLDYNVRKLLEFKMKTPAYKKIKSSGDLDISKHAQFIRDISGECMVLLKNENKALPFSKKIHKIALLGASSYELVGGGNGSGFVFAKHVVELDEALESEGYVLNKTLDNLYKEHFVVENERRPKRSGGATKNGSGKIEPPRELQISDSKLKKELKKSDAVVITISRTSIEATDRGLALYKLNEEELRLISFTSKVCRSKGKKVIVVLNVTGAVETANWKHLADGIIMAFTPGQEVGYAITDVLSGKSNPSGKLPMTLANDYSDHLSSKNFPIIDPEYYVAPVIIEAGGTSEPVTTSKKKVERNNKKIKNYQYTNYEEDIWVGYRYFNTANKMVSYPFGFGLSYTTFEYGNPSIKKVGDTWEAKIEITNTGNVAGKEIVQLYIKAAAGDIEKPNKELKAFGKTKILEPGAKEIVTMSFDAEDLASFNEKSSSWITDKGVYTAYFSENIEKCNQKIDFRVRKKYKKKVSNVLECPSELKIYTKSDF